jgi:hypothetical protein
MSELKLCLIVCTTLSETFFTPVSGWQVLFAKHIVSHTHTGLHVMYPVLLPDFIQNLNAVTNFGRNPKYFMKMQMQIFTDYKKQMDIVLQIFIANAPQNKGNEYVLTLISKIYCLWEW